MLLSWVNPNSKTWCQRVRTCAPTADQTGDSLMQGTIADEVDGGKKGRKGTRKCREKNVEK